MQTNDICAPKKLLHRVHVCYAMRCRGRRRVRVVRNDSRAEAQREDLAREQPNAPCADDADRLACDVHPEQAVEQEVALAHAVVRLVVLAHDGHDHADGELGDGLRRVGGHACNDEPVTCCGDEVDVIVPSAAQSDEFL